MSAPVIHGIRPRYKVNDIIRGNCTSKYSRPAANLTWTINDVTVSKIFGLFFFFWYFSFSIVGLLGHYRVTGLEKSFCRFSCSN